MLAAVGIFIFGVLLFTADYGSAHREIAEGFERNDYGGGSRTEEVRAEVGDQDGKQEVGELDVELSEQTLAAGETQQMFDRCIEKIQEQILGENEDLDHVESDLNLMSSLEGESVSISWDLDSYEVMNMSGELQREALVKEGTPVELTAVLTYDQDPGRQALYVCTVTVYPKTLTAAEQTKEDLETIIREEEENSREEKTFKLPALLSGEQVKYYREMDNRGPVLMVLGLVIGVLAFAMKKQNEDQAKEKRRQQMMLDYPEILNKLTLFLGAGMTVKRAFRKIVTDYEEQKKTWGTRYAYEEMRQACHEMDSGVTEARCYEEFGKRCELQEYLRFGALLSQNLKRGSKGLNQTLAVEAAQAFGERKARARQLGEEASTKLLIPMCLMLVVVLIVAIVPAFLSMSI